MNTMELVPTTDVEVTASTPVEMAGAQRTLIAWCESKIKSVMREAEELWENFKIAKTNKWKTSTLERHAKLADKRVGFYGKLKAALEAGFYIVPNFPVDVFTIRTEAKSPKAMVTFSHWDRHKQDAQILQAGEGEYKNPFPAVFERPKEATEQGKVVIKNEYYAKEFEDMEFPVNMAKPQIMLATERAMALKIFDDLGVLPSSRRNQDPVIVGRIFDPRSTGYRRTQRHVSFIIAWHLDTKTL